MTDDQELKVGDWAVVMFEGSEMFVDGTERIGLVYELDPIIVGGVSIGRDTEIAFGPDSYRSVEPCSTPWLSQ